MHLLQWVSAGVQISRNAAQTATRCAMPPIAAFRFTRESSLVEPRRAHAFFNSAE
jgi:hypothetical protein